MLRGGRPPLMDRNKLCLMLRHVTPENITPWVAATRVIKNEINPKSEIKRLERKFPLLFPDYVQMQIRTQAWLEACRRKHINVNNILRSYVDMMTEAMCGGVAVSDLDEDFELIDLLDSMDDGMTDPRM